MLPVLLALLAGSAVGLVFDGGSLECAPGNTLPPTCLLVLDRGLGPAPFGLIGEVGTGGVTFWCLGLEQQAVEQDLSSGGSIVTDPVRARVSAGCTPFR